MDIILPMASPGHGSQGPRQAQDIGLVVDTIPAGVVLATRRETLLWMPVDARPVSSGRVFPHTFIAIYSEELQVKFLGLPKKTLD